MGFVVNWLVLLVVSWLDFSLWVSLLFCWFKLSWLILCWLLISFLVDLWWGRLLLLQGLDSVLEFISSHVMLIYTQRWSFVGHFSFLNLSFAVDWLEPKGNFDEGSKDVAPERDVSPEVHGALLQNTTFAKVNKKHELGEMSAIDQDLRNENQKSGWLSETLPGENSPDNPGQINTEEDRVDGSWLVVPGDSNPRVESPSEHEDGVVVLSEDVSNGSALVLVHESDFIDEALITLLDLVSF
jgi:hypothetical protein